MSLPNSVIATHRRARMYDHASSVAKTAEEARAHIPPEQLRDPVAKLRVVHLDERNALGAKHRKESLELRSKQDAARAKDRALSNGAVVTHEWVAKEAADRRELEHSTLTNAASLRRSTATSWKR